jgi:hypothetical protein
MEGNTFQRDIMRDITRHDSQRQEISRTYVPPRMRPCQIAGTVPKNIDTTSQDQL